MKTVCSVSLLMFLAFASCTKNDSLEKETVTTITIGEDTGCIYRVWGLNYNPIVSPADSAMAAQLLEANGIDPAGIRFYYVHKDSFGPGQSVVNIRGSQYVNGLPLLTNDADIRVRNGILEYAIVNHARATSTDTVPSLKLTQVRALFSRELQRQNGGFDKKALLDSCDEAKFGYMYPNGNDSLLIRAWYVTIPGGGLWGYFRDDGTLISFSGGIIIE